MQDTLVRGVIETLITERAVLRYLPFLTVNGSGVTYNQELTLPGATFHGVNAPGRPASQPCSSRRR